jgi:myosin-5
MDIESRVWIKISGEKPWQKGVISHIVTLEVNKLTSCIKKNFKFYIQDNSTGEFTGEAGEISSWSLEGLDDEFEYVKLRNMNESEDVSKVDDLVTLSYLHEPAILICLRSRFEQDLIYTNTGPILIALNPFKKLSIYSPEVVAYYRQSGEQRKYGLEGSHTPPHVYKIADNAFRQMVNNFYDEDSDQSILVSGESGSGNIILLIYTINY